MERVKGLIKRSYKFFIGIVIGAILDGCGVYAVTYINSENVSYDNTSSGLSSTNMQDALDEAYQKSEIKNRSNIVEAYTYSTAASTKCIVGTEETCVKTNCHKSTNVGSCPAGTIIMYKVNQSDIITFHVMYDKGSTMTMQSQKNIVTNTLWMNEFDYSLGNTDSTACDYDSCNDEGPMTILVALEQATKTWTNVNDQTYTMGTTIFAGDNAYTGCSTYDTCDTNTYTLGSRTAKARMITLQELVDLGCITSYRSCPIWVYNFLYWATNFGATVGDDVADVSTGKKNSGYGTMTARSDIQMHAWKVYNYGSVTTNYHHYNPIDGARAVVVVNK